MAEKDEFYVPEEVDRQIELVSQSQEGDQMDAEALAYLRSFYQADARQEALDRMWGRIAGAAFFKPSMQESEKKPSMQNPSMSYGAIGNWSGSSPGRTPLMQRLSTLAAVVFLVVLVGSLALVFYAVRHSGGTGTPRQPPTISTGHVPLKVTAVDMSVTPGSIVGLTCGTNLTVTYTALFHVRPHSGGGVVRFTYTVNNGRSATPASITFKPGETTRSFSFTWKGKLPLDHTYPGLGGVQVTSPNHLTSQLVKPAGLCRPAKFQVTSVDMAVSPASIQGLSCGTSIVVTYTATIHVAPNSAGGVVQFTYTVNNGRGQTPASITFKPGETAKTFTFTWSGALPPDHTYPGLGGIQVTSPNQLTSALVAPVGRCS